MDRDAVISPPGARGSVAPRLEPFTSYQAFMPGYRLLASHVSGPVADCIRDADLLRCSGDVAGAAAVLERALEAAARRPEMPASICGRLAALYRTLGRYDDEVGLLERYADSHVADDLRARFTARLSKARALAERHRRFDTGALRTVRESRIRARKRPRSAEPDLAVSRAS